MNDRLQIFIEPATSPVALSLIAKLDRDLSLRYPGVPTHGIDEETFAHSGGVFAVAYLHGNPVACGAVRPLGDAGEIKRMFVDAEFRGRGFARRMLAFLESAALARGFKRLVLETGIHQPEAIRLYESCGWTPIDVYGEYIDALHESRCYEKYIAIFAEQ